MFLQQTEVLYRIISRSFPHPVGLEVTPTGRLAEWKNSDKPFPENSPGVDEAPADTTLKNCPD